MINPFKAAFNFFRSALDPIVKQLKTNEGRDKATHTLASVIQLGEHAVPMVRTALAVGGSVAGIDTAYEQSLLKAGAKLGLKIEAALAEPDEYARMGKLIRLEGGGLRDDIANNILPHAKDGIEIGDVLVKDVATLNLIPNGVLEAAVHNAHVALSVAGEVVKPVVPPALTAAPPSHAEVNLEL
jgi:hypothetical protein